MSSKIDYSDFPKPPLPADTDMRSWHWFEFDVGELGREKYWLACKKNPSAGFFMMNLFRAAWHHVPAGSIEDDDDVLADAAMCPPEAWGANKADTLRGWTLCSDGRWYSDFLFKKVKAAMKKKGNRFEQTRAANERRAQLAEERREAQRREAERCAAQCDTSTSRSRDVDATYTRRSPEEKIGEEKIVDSDASHLAPQEGADDEKAALEALRKEAWSEGKRIVTALTGMPKADAGRIVGSLADAVGKDLVALLSILREAERRKPLDPVSWLMGAAQARGKPGAKAARPGLEERMAEAIGLSLGARAGSIIDHVPEPPFGGEVALLS